MNSGTTMNKHSILAAFVAILAVPCAAHAQQSLPPTVETYLTGIEGRLLAESQVQEAKDDVLGFRYSLLFCKPAIDYRSGSSDAWVLGLGLGEVKGKALTNVARIVVIAADGTEIFRYPDPARGEELLDGEYTNAIVVDMAPGVSLIAMSIPAGRSGPGEVSVRTLAQNPQELLTYRDDNFPGEPGLESDLYFYDVDSGGRKEVLVEQQVLRYSQGQKKTQRRIYKLESSNQSFVEVTSKYQTQLDSIFTAAKNNTATPKITQHSRPYESTVFASPTP